MKLFQNDHLYTINNKEMLDAAVKDDAKGQKNLKLNLFQPKIDVKNNPLSWRTKFGFSLGHFFNDAVSWGSLKIYLNPLSIANSSLAKLVPHRYPAYGSAIRYSTLSCSSATQWPAAWCWSVKWPMQ